MIRTFSVLTVSALALSACSGDPGGPSAGTTSPGSAPVTPTTSLASGTSSVEPTPKPSSPTSPGASCVDGLLLSMSPAQRAGQLVMVGLDASMSAESLDTMIKDHHIGNMFFIGGWRATSRVKSTSDHVQAQVNSSSTKSVGFLIAADQEGGQVQQLKGDGFSPLPSALRQGAMSSADRAAVARTIVRELKAVGVNVDLAPVADTVPPANPRSNEPIGRWGRQYGNNPAKAGSAVAEVVRTMQAGGLQSTLKHFPGLGRIKGNTDFTADDIVDDQTSADDEYLRPFRDGIAAGAPFVMVSSAYYSRMDAENQAIYSPKIIDGVLRRQLGFGGVVMSDDLNAVAVRDLPAGERVVKMVRAGGDVALTGLASAAPLMARALTAEAAKDPVFRAKLNASVKRVLTAKTAMGLTSCSGRE